MNAPISAKKPMLSVGTSLVSAVAFLLAVTCIIAAAPRDFGDSSLPVDIDEPTRIEAPVTDDVFDERPLDPAVTRAPEADGTIRITQSVKSASPETVTETSGAPETRLPETTGPETGVKPVPADEPDETTDVPEETTVPKETTGVPEETTAPAEETTAPVEETTAPPEETTAPPEETTAPPEETTAPPEETTAPLEETTAPPEDDKNLAARASSPMLVDEFEIKHSIDATLIEVSEAEVLYAATIIQLEVMGHGSPLSAFADQQLKYWEMLAVAQTIRNRMESNQFPDTAYDVMFQVTGYYGRYGNIPVYQFHSPERINRSRPTEEALIAAREVLVNGVTILPENYFFFCATTHEETFESSNIINYKENGEPDKIRGHASTFYGGAKDR